MTGQSGSGPAPRVSVIVANFNGERWLARCLEQVLADGGERVEIIVVDNGSSDGSASLVRDRFPCVRFLALERNLGYAAANNRGADIARGALLAFLNNDTEVSAGWCAALERALGSDPAVALAASRIVFLHDPDVVDSAGDGMTRVGGAFKRGHGDLARHWTTGGEVFGACGAAFMIRREVFAEIGGFDEDFFLVYEDVDLSYRARLRGYRCVYVPEAVVRHAGSASLGRLSETAVFHGQRNLEWCYVKNTPWPVLALTFPAHLVYDMVAAAVFAARGQLPIWLRAKAAALGGLPAMLRRRAAVQRDRITSSRDTWHAMTPGWLRLKTREKRFEHRPSSIGTRGEG